MGGSRVKDMKIRWLGWRFLLVSSTSVLWNGVPRPLGGPVPGRLPIMSGSIAIPQDTIIGQKYRINRKIGSGSFGEIYSGTMVYQDSNQQVRETVPSGGRGGGSLSAVCGRPMTRRRRRDVTVGAVATRVVISDPYRRLRSSSRKGARDARN